MTLFFNWARLVARNKTKAGLLKDVKKAIYRPNFHMIPDGYSFLLNPDKFARSVKDLDYYYDYLELAALRNYFDVEFLKDTTLARVYAPHYYSEGRLQSNPLLIITDTQIKFTLE